MGSTDKRSKKRKSKKPTASKTSNPRPMTETQNAIGSHYNVELDPQDTLLQQKGLSEAGDHLSFAKFTELQDQQGLQEIQKLMDADGDAPMPPLSRGPNPYLGRNRCLLCQCERPGPLKDNKEQITDLGDDSKSGVDSLSQLHLWVCPECKKTVEEEEKRSSMATLLEPELRLDYSLMPGLAGCDPAQTGTLCNCHSCRERRLIESEHEKETQVLQQCWVELRHVVRYIYREAGTGLSAKEGGSAVPDTNKLKELVHKLCLRDPHQLFQRLESQGREYVIEMKVRLMKHLSSGPKSPNQARHFVSFLLEEYSNLCDAAKQLSSFLTELEQDHLNRFNLVWELHNKHLFHSIIYVDPDVQNNLPMLITQLRLSSSKDGTQDGSDLLALYVQFDNEMTKISAVWGECYQLLEQYNNAQTAMSTKQKMLKEDVEFFRAQRKQLEQQVLTNQVPNSNAAHQFEVQFTETMQNILQGNKSSGEECHCPNCNTKRCPCDECTISHMITCGIINPEVADQMPMHKLTFPHDPSRYIIDVTPPSMSSTGSSSGSDSPIPVDRERLLAFDDNFELAEEEIAEEIDDASKSDSEEEIDEEERKAHCDRQRNKADNREDGTETFLDQRDEEDEDGDDEDEDDDDYEEEEDDDEEEDDEEEDEEEDEDEEEEEGEEETEPAVTTAVGFGPPYLTKGDTCDCSHCTFQAKVEQAAKTAAAAGILSSVEGAATTCQCHACLQQSGKSLGAPLPQHMPSAPRPAALHLYPHIHGANNFHTGLHNHSGHPRSVFHPQLYELHTPNRQQVQVIGQTQTKCAMDGESGSEVFPSHKYHAYEEWDNNYDSAKLLVGSHMYAGGLAGELYSPTPPLLTANQFVADGALDSSMVSVAQGSAGIQQCMSSVARPLATTSVSTSATFSGLCEQPRDRLNLNSLQNTSQTSILHQTSIHNKPTAVMPNSSMGSFSIGTSTAGLLTSNAGTVVSTTRPDSGVCMKHAPFLYNHHMSLANMASHHNLGTLPTSQPVASHSLGMKLNTQVMQTSGTSKADSQQQQLNSLNHSIACSHSTSLSSATSVMSKPSLPTNSPTDSAGIYHMGGLLNGSGQQGAPPGPTLAGNLNNVSVGTSTSVCSAPDCDGQHDDNYDSIDDSCSEQSSSTSTSNQKDGKYCDCCYCEFFGHSTPPSLPTSRNYAEMRDRLRLRLKKKNEAKERTEPEKEGQPKPKEDILYEKGLDELMRFINGDENDAKNGKQISARAAKRQRQKQRKLEEKARKDAAEKVQEHQEQMLSNLMLSKLSQEQARQFAHPAPTNQQPQRKKRSKHKELIDSRDSPSPKDSSCRPNGGIENLQQNPIPNHSSITSLPTSQATKHRISHSGSVQAGLSKTLLRNCYKQAEKARQLSSSKQQLQASLENGHCSKQTNTNHNTPNGSCQKPTSAQNGPCQNQAFGSVDGRTCQKPANATTTHLQTDKQKRDAKQQSAMTKELQNLQQKLQQRQAASKVAAAKTAAPPAVSPQKPAPPTQPIKTTSCPTVQSPLQQSLAQGKRRTNKKTILASNLAQTSHSENIMQNSCPPQQPTREQMQKAVAMVNARNHVNHQPQHPPAKGKCPTPIMNGSVSPPKVQPDKNQEMIVGTAKSSPRDEKKEDRSPKANEQGAGGRRKKNKRKNKGGDEMTSLDEIFLPKDDVENGDLDEFEREIEEFKRFCMSSTPKERKEKLPVNVNLKDIFSKKKSGLGCA